METHETSPVENQEPAPQAEPVPAGEAADAGPDIAEIERRAEERGYLRGRNERIEELMAAPGIWQQVQPQERFPGNDGPVPTILQNLRGDIWSI